MRLYSNAVLVGRDQEGHTVALGERNTIERADVVVDQHGLALVLAALHVDGHHLLAAVSHIGGLVCLRTVREHGRDDALLIFHIISGREGSRVLCPDPAAHKEENQQRDQQQKKAAPLSPEPVRYRSFLHLRTSVRNFC